MAHRHAADQGLRRVAPDGPLTEPPLAVLYDRDCGFCRWSLALLLRRDPAHALRPVAIQSDEGQRLLASVPSRERLRSAHAIDADGTVHSGGDALAVVVRRLPRGAPVALIARALPLPVRVVYRGVANNRVRLSRLVSAQRKADADAVLAARESEDAA